MGKHIWKLSLEDVFHASSTKSHDTSLDYESR